jgi:hypothetical protein
MSSALCPNCKNVVRKVKPVRIPSDADSPHWKGRVPPAMGFICPSCAVLLPLTATNERDD